MTDKPQEPEASPEAAPHLEVPTLLSSMPWTDPAILQVMEDEKLRADHYSALGRVVAAWAYLEAVVDTWLIHFSQLDFEIGVCFTSQILGSRPKIDAFIALVRHLGCDQKWNVKLEEFAKDAVGLSEQRNRATHDVWRLREAKNPKRLEATAKRKVRLLEIEVPTSELWGLLQNILVLQTRFDDLANAIFTEIYASPDKSQTGKRLSGRKRQDQDNNAPRRPKRPQSSPP